MGVGLYVRAVDHGRPAPARTISDPAPARGFLPAGAYTITEIESINNTNGDVILNVPLGSPPPGRGGHTHGVSLIYNSKIYDIGWDYSSQYLGQNVLTATPTNSETGGWQYSWNYWFQVEEKPNPTGGYTCPLSEQDSKHYRVKLFTPDGGQHLMRPTGSAGCEDGWGGCHDLNGDGFYRVQPDGKMFNPCPTGRAPDVQGPMVYFSVDGTFLRLEVDHDDDNDWTNNPWTLYFPDGRKVDGTDRAPLRSECGTATATMSHLGISNSTAIPPRKFWTNSAATS